MAAAGRHQGRLRGLPTHWGTMQLCEQRERAVLNMTPMCVLCQEGKTCRFLTSNQA